MWSSLLFALLPATLSFPTSPQKPQGLRDPSYQCGYVLTIHNSSAYAGLSAYAHCEPFYKNYTTNDWQEAYAYGSWGGCRCAFYVSEAECRMMGNAPEMEDPTVVGKEPVFDDPKPRWYNCGKSG
ncbi:hypothetical protein ACN47E_002659 [Coniothyrium glycines]